MTADPKTRLLLTFLAFAPVILPLPPVVCDMESMRRGESVLTGLNCDIGDAKMLFLKPIYGPNHKVAGSGGSLGGSIRYYEEVSSIIKVRRGPLL